MHVGLVALQVTASKASATSCLSVTKLETPNKNGHYYPGFLNHRNCVGLDVVISPSI